MITTLDVETTFHVGETKRADPTPFHPNNRLVSVQYNTCQDKTPKFVWFYHEKVEPDLKKSHSQVQQILDETTLLVGHNIKFDLVWLWESGFTYNGRVYDTMIGEYILLKGQKYSLSLHDSCIRRKVSQKKTEIIQDYLSRGVGFDRMPTEIVEEYGLADIVSTRELYEEQTKLFGNSMMNKHIKLMNGFLPVLSQIERNGIKIDVEALQRVKEAYKKEKLELERTMHEIMREVMGDTPINFASPEQISQMIYSRKVKDKKHWASMFNIGLNEKGKPLTRPRMSVGAFVRSVKALTERVYKTTAIHCNTCSGKGSFFKRKKNGQLWKKETKCRICKGKGYLLKKHPQVAGLTMNPRDVRDVSANGFATDKNTMLRLLEDAKRKGNATAEKFLKCSVRLNAVDVYLSSFVGGIERNVKQNDVLHPKYNQCVTRTTRLSSSDPNFQNQPRGNTFPVRAVVVSRFEGGKILQADYSQLEFRVAAQLSGDEVMKKDILDGSDVHKYTASIIFDKDEKDVTKDERTMAKAHTFKPLYGGTHGTPNEMAYYRDFMDKYPRLAKWHEDLQAEAITEGSVTLYTGQQFAFPGTERLASGAASNAPAIKNYPVQGLAGGCIMPLALIRLQSAFSKKGIKSLIINTVHDSVVIDVYPGEEDVVSKLAYKAMADVTKTFEDYYNVKWSVPFGVDLEMGYNWLEMETISLTS
jgi:DNA polymerase I-like protein with 3'-5' exonuclease and polymerase domains